MPFFDKLQALKKFTPHNLAKEPLSAERARKYALEACGWRLLFGTERIDDVSLQALYHLAEESSVLAKMRSQQAGEAVNISEKRAALHTALRAPQTDHIEAIRLAHSELQKLEAFTSHINGKYDDVVLIGIGGSELGASACVRALSKHYVPKAGFTVFSSYDDVSYLAKLATLDLQRTLFVVISKTGGSAETIHNESLVRSYLQQKGIDPRKQMLSVSMPGTQLSDHTRFLATFHLWDFVGGRFSVSSMCGGVVISLLFGYHIFADFLAGAHEMDKNALAPIKHNLPLHLALLTIWNRNVLGAATYALIPYASYLQPFISHLQQLEMESNGKPAQGYFTAPVLWGDAATASQHSFFQHLHQTADRPHVGFIGFGDSCTEMLANLLAQSVALAEGKGACLGNVGNHILAAHTLDAKTLGALVALFEHKVAFLGYLWEINSFDQPGVQLGKELATRLLPIAKAASPCHETQAAEVLAAQVKCWNG